MAGSEITIARIVTEALEASDMSGSNFATTARVRSWANLELAELYDLIVGAHEDLAVRLPPYTFSTEADRSRYDLPSHFYKLRKARIQEGSDLIGMKPFDLGQEHLGKDPDQAKTINLIVIPQYDPLDDPDEPINWGRDFQLAWGWHEAAIHGLAARLAVKEESDPMPHMLAKQTAHKRIAEMAPNPDEAEASQVGIGHSRDLAYSSDFDDLEEGEANQPATAWRYCLAGGRILIKRF